MAKIKYTKTEQKHQQDSLKQFLRFLPTLQLKKQQLQQEVRISVEKLSANRIARKEALERLAGLLLFFSTPQESEKYISLVEVKSIITSTMNIAGITIPVFERVEFAPLETKNSASLRSLKKLNNAESFRERSVIASRLASMRSTLSRTSSCSCCFFSCKVGRKRRNCLRASC